MTRERLGSGLVEVLRETSCELFRAVLLEGGEPPQKLDRRFFAVSLCRVGKKPGKTWCNRYYDDCMHFDILIYFAHHTRHQIKIAV